MTSAIDPTAAPAEIGRPQTTAEPQTPAAPAVQRQFVNFAFYKLAPEFRRISDHEKLQARSEFLCLFQHRRPGLQCLTYSTVGLKGDSDILLWRIATSTDEFQTHSQSINKSRLGAYLQMHTSFLSMTKRSMYIDKLDPFHTMESRTHIIPGKRKYLFIYPFVKTREWYLLPQAQRQTIMDEHIRVGNKYPSVKLNTTYSFGLDDQDFVVAFESDEPKDFLDLVQELRETQGSKYTQRDTPIFTCVQMPMENLLDQLF
ncbi:MAG TPA: chlorite dismutase family protein [Tepidisphaeraceae bacterium]|jgi:chlorite dismutase|nr:chlorite dismutase family protein [Tepidisphaeraceae bacterium]